MIGVFLACQETHVPAETRYVGGDVRVRACACVCVYYSRLVD